MTNKEIDSLMVKVRPSHKYCWSLLKSHFVIYEFTITEKEWEDWLERNPINAMTSKKGWEIPQTSRGHIPFKREGTRR